MITVDILEAPGRITNVIAGQSELEGSRVPRPVSSEKRFVCAEKSLYFCAETRFFSMLLIYISGLNVAHFTYTSPSYALLGSML